MADQRAKTPITQPVISIPGMVGVPWVAIKLPNGQIALRHPDELQKIPSPAKAKGAKQ